MRWLVVGLALVGCERTVSSDADCVAWVDTCGGCAQQCTAAWDEDEQAQSCDIDCQGGALPACVADAGSCVFAD